MNTIYSFLPKSIENHILTIPPSERLGMEEIRVRIGRPLEVFINGQSIFFHSLFLKRMGTNY